LSGVAAGTQELHRCDFIQINRSLIFYGGVCELKEEKIETWIEEN
jgi:hypothetical protein